MMVKASKRKFDLRNVQENKTGVSRVCACMEKWIGIFAGMSHLHFGEMDKTLSMVICST